MRSTPLFPIPAAFDNILAAYERLSLKRTFPAKELLHFQLRVFHNHYIITRPEHKTFCTSF